MVVGTVRKMRKPRSTDGRLDFEQGIVAEGGHHQTEHGGNQQPAQGDQETAHAKVHACPLVTGLHFILVHHFGHDHIADQYQPAQTDAEHDRRGIGEVDVR